MKKATKILLTLLCAALLVTGTILGTIAYLIDSEEVVNTFTVGNVDIKVDEAKVSEDGEPVTPAERVAGNEYHLIPGQTYTKDPTMTVVKGSEESYVRLLVTITNAAELKAIFGNTFDPKDYAAGWDDTVWVPGAVKEDTTANTLTYEYRYYKTVDAYEATDDIVLEPLFTEFTLPGDKVNGQQLKTLEGLKITVEGHAIQRVALDTADAAWAAFDAQYANENNP